jgi:hypothetical protein
VFRRREPVPFSPSYLPLGAPPGPPGPGGLPLGCAPRAVPPVAEADRFRSNVQPPPRRRADLPQIAGRTLLGLTVMAGLVGALLFGTPALEVPRPGTDRASQSEAKDSRLIEAAADRPTADPGVVGTPEHR